MNTGVVLGIDYSSTSTGVVGVSQVGEYLFSHLITHKSKSFDERILNIGKQLFSIVNDLKEDILVIGIESPALFAKGKVIDLSAGYGYLKYSLLSLNFNVVTYPPSQIKKFATGNGRAGKEDMVEVLPNDVRLDFEDKSKKIDDLADAYHIARLSLQNYLKGLV